MLLRRLLALVAALFVVLIAGCDSGSAPTLTPISTSVPLATATQVPQAPVETTPTGTAFTVPSPTLAPTLEPTAVPTASLPTTPPATPTQAALVSITDQALVQLFKAAGPPIGEVVIYTAETDPNHLLGRPNQYLAKASWHDTRLPSPTNPAAPEVSDGGGVEIYADPDAAKARADYLQAIGKGMPALAEYDYLNGPILLRLSKDLTPSQAADYRQVLDTVALSPSTSAQSLTAVAAPAPPAGTGGVTDQGITQALKAASLPIGEVIIYTAETDPNHLLGRPNGYVAKATWHDTRLPAPKAPNALEVSDGGGIEIYPDAAGAKNRMDYIQEAGKKLPMLVEYDFVNGPVLLRLSQALTPTQAQEYKQALDKLPTQ